MKKVWKFLSSMKFAIILLVVLAAACSLGSFIQQGKSYEYYSAEYGEQV
ncbi:MAG: cytochrome c biogenesis protein ResB, partial [Oscillospiraceae bacterium]|nr:cytochrome c biogenesis protein ResB [Oscillospiraceae bacterium]